MNSIKSNSGFDTKTEYKKNYNLVNKSIINEKQNERIQCECGCTSARGNLTRHRKTQRHINLMNNKQ